jgi:hypothetical protein
MSRHLSEPVKQSEPAANSVPTGENLAHRAEMALGNAVASPNRSGTLARPFATYEE